MYFRDRDGQLGIRAGTRRRHAAAPFVVPGGRHGQQPAAQRHRQALVGQLTDHRVDHFGRMLSRAK